MTKKIDCDSSFNKILIYGLGVIGGSIAKKLRITNSKLEIYGIARRQETAKQAIELGIVDDADVDFKKFAGDVDLIIFSVPPMKVLEILQEIYPDLKNDVLITDVSSVKGKVYDEIKKLVAENNLKYSKNVVYIGSHPMAGSEKKGLENSTKNMLDDSTVLITPFSKTSAKNVQQIEKFWQALGCQTKVISAARHDIFTAYTSHFNHLISGVITNVIRNQFESDNDIKSAIGSSFKDMTRISDSDSELWTEIVKINNKNLKMVLEDYKKQIGYLEQILDEKNDKKILKFLKDAKKNRSQLLDK